MAEIHRVKMPVSQRAKQFAPFAALKGFEEAIMDKEKIILPMPELSEDMAEYLNLTINQLETGKKIAVTFFSNGEYINYIGSVTKIDFDNRLLLINNTSVFFDDIIDIILL